MRPVSDAFLRSLSGSHTIVSRATVCTAFQTGVSPIGTRLNVVSGDVQLDSTADVRSSCDVTVIGDWPDQSTDLLTPYGNEIFLERGIQYNDGSVEYVGLGYHRIDTIDQSDNPNSRVIRVTGYDRMKGITEARLLQPRQFLNGTTFGVVVANLINEIYPLATIQWDDNTNNTTLTRSVVCDEDRFGFLNDAITSRGKIWYWDYRGVLVIKNVPDPTVPVYAVTNGTKGVLVNGTRSLSRASAYNAFVASGESVDQSVPVRGIAIDNNPKSPTYFYGSFGQVPAYYSSQFLATDADCLAVATSLLTKHLGIPYSISFGTIPNPALEPYDPVSVKLTYNDAAQTHVIDTINIPLSAGDTQKADTRQKLVTLPS